MKVLLHINELNKWHMVESNIENLFKMSNHIEISVVANGDAVTLFKDKSLDLNKNVSYYICQNSLNKRLIDRKDIHQDAYITPSGVYKIILLENEGYGYIKP